MNNAEIYHTTNTLSTKDARQCLEEYGKKIEWKKNGATIIDIGCGDGRVTCILKTFLPDNCKEFVGCDISEDMIQFANARYAEDFIRFTVLNIEGDLPDQLRAKFDHAFSFYALHWIENQQLAFSNVYDLLASGGSCLLLIMGHLPVYDIWRQLARSPRWNYWLKDVDRFVSSYHDSQDPEKDVEIMMTTAGFTNMEIKCLQKEIVYSGKEVFKNTMDGINPFKVPLEMQEDFWADFIKAAQDMKLVDQGNNNEDNSFNVKLNYKAIVAYAKK